ncbi:tetratricopeptide repeat protein [Candidatus Woesearchaeota archaeon]|nr:tetratricopeptide repeat protein [Candidatus Woesearchaeota archaeon]
MKKPEDELENLEGMLREIKIEPSEASDPDIKKKANEHFEKGVACYRRKSLEEAVAEFRQAIGFDSDYVAARNNLGVVLYERGELEEAETQLRAAISLRDNDADLYVNLGNVLSDRGRLGEAIESYATATGIDPKNAVAFNNKGVTYIKARQLDLAVKTFRKALEINSENPTIHLNLANVLRENGDNAGSILEYQKAMELIPGGDEETREGVEEKARQWTESRKDKDFYFYFHLGIIYHGVINDKAIEAYRESIRLNPNYSHSRFDLGILLSVKGDKEGAEKEFREAIRIDPNYSRAHSSLGRLLWKQGKHDEGLKECRKAVECKPNEKYSHVFLGDCLYDNGDFEGAAVQFKEALRIDHHYRYAIMRLRSALYKDLGTKKGLSALKDEAEKNPDKVYAQVCLAIALTTEGNTAGAGDAYRKAIELGGGIKGGKLTVLKEK